MRVPALRGQGVKATLPRTTWLSVGTRWHVSFGGAPAAALAAARRATSMAGAPTAVAHREGILGGGVGVKTYL